MELSEAIERLKKFDCKDCKFIACEQCEINFGDVQAIKIVLAELDRLQKENEAKIYDTLACNGFFDKFFEVLPESEYEDLMEYIEDIMEDTLTYKNTAGAVLQSVIQDLPRNAQAAADIVKSFDPKQFQAVIDFATAANGGRNIETNQ